MRHQRFLAALLGVPAILSFATSSARAADEVVWDADLDLDESQRSLWPSIVAALVADGAVVDCVGDALPNNVAESMYQRAVTYFKPSKVDDLRGFYQVDFPAGTNLAAKLAQISAKAGVEEIRLATEITVAGDLPPLTAPVLAPNQGYFFNPHVSHIPTGTGSLGGHNLPAIRQFAGTGATVRTAILEFGAYINYFNPGVSQPRHEDLLGANITMLFPNPGQDYRTGRTAFEIDHGTATLGIHCADQDVPGNPLAGPGCTGATPSAQIFFVPFQSVQAGQHLAAAILVAANAVGPRGVINASLQATAGNLPISVNAAVRTAIQFAVASGCHFVEAAGNGGTNLNPLNIPNDGALWVGALNPTNGARMGFSNFGSQVRVCSWGNGVTTLGAIGGGVVLGAPASQQYTNSYNGTSSAAAIVSALIASSMDAWNTTFAAGVVPAPAVGAPTGSPLDPATMFLAMQQYAPAGGSGAQSIGVFPNAASISHRIGSVPYGLGSSNACGGTPCGIVPTLDFNWTDPPTGARIFAEPAAGGGSFAYRVGFVPYYNGSPAAAASAISVSTASANVVLPGMPGPVFININAPFFLFSTAPVLNGPFLGGCASSPTCGECFPPLPLPPAPILNALTIFLQGSTTSTFGDLGLTNGMKLTLQN